MKATKGILLNVRLSEEEQAHLKILADSEALSVSDYVRRRLFDDEAQDMDYAHQGESQAEATRNRFNCDHDRELMRSLIRVLAMVQLMCKETVEHGKIANSYALAENQLKEWGYE